MSKVTQLLHRMDSGDEAAGDELLPLLYEELRRIAGSSLKHQSSGHTLQPTALVNEAWIRLLGSGAPASFNDRQHFLRTAATAMRHVLVDHARRSLRIKRGEGLDPMPLESLSLANGVSAMDVIEVHDALNSLEEVDPELAELVKLRYFGGYAMPDVAALLDISLSTAERRWRMARAWLQQSL